MDAAPDTFRAGDSIAWTLSDPAYPASAGWSVRYRIVFTAGVAVEIETTASGDNHVVDIPAAASAAWSVGRAALVCLATRGAERRTLGSKPVEVLPDIGVVGQYDARTRNQRALDDLEAALADYAAAGQGHVAEYQVAGRVMKFRDVDQIQALIAHYRRLVAQERRVLALLDGAEPPGRCYYRAGR